jgi:hypothetical protein
MKHHPCLVLVASPFPRPDDVVMDRPSPHPGRGLQDGALRPDQKARGALPARQPRQPRQREWGFGGGGKEGVVCQQPHKREWGFGGRGKEGVICQRVCQRGRVEEGFPQRAPPEPQPRQAHVGWADLRATDHPEVKRCIATDESQVDGGALFGRSKIHHLDHVLRVIALCSRGIAHATLACTFEMTSFVVAESPVTSL